uniref:Uncharacterized protein n=1 Tax=Solanum tuberosum TaxID=4113 RepID=M1DTA9_SOLTU
MVNAQELEAQRQRLGPEAETAARGRRSLNASWGGFVSQGPILGAPVLHPRTYRMVHDPTHGPNEGLRTRQRHYDGKRSKKVGKSEEKRSWSSQKLIGDSPSEFPARKIVQLSSPWINPTRRVKKHFSDASNGTSKTIQLAKSSRTIVCNS